MKKSDLPRDRIFNSRASLISHVIRNLASNPTIAAQVRAEVLAVGDKPLDFDQLPRIKSLQNVITETLRLYPVFPQNNRVALKDTILPAGGGSDGNAPVFAPAGTLFDACFATLHRDPNIWGPNADEFVPPAGKTITALPHSPSCRLELGPGSAWHSKRRLWRPRI
ncbi:cytochrome P450 [Seiridium cupressi]